MWLITGPFDGDYVGETPPPHKCKLLKTGREYMVGRRDAPLLLKTKAVSKTHAVFIVGECTEEQAADPHFIPKLTLRNLTDRKRNIERPTQPEPRMECLGKSDLELQSEDVIHMCYTAHVSRWWNASSGVQRGICLSWNELKHINDTWIERKSPTWVGFYDLRDALVDACRDSFSFRYGRQGIQVVPTLLPEVTHHLTPTYTLNPAIATSLISLANLVKPEWLVAVLEAGRAEEGELSALEDTFTLPPTNKYRPAFTPALPSRLKKFDVWQQNEERVSMFHGHRFIFAGEKGSEAPSALKELVSRAAGDYECFAVEGGPERLRKVLAKGKARGATVVLIADHHAVIPVVGEEGWMALVEEAKSFDLKFLAPEKVVEAVVYVDLSYIDSSGAADEPVQQSVLPDVVPNTIEDEPSIPPSPPAGTVEPQPGPSPEPEPVEEAPKRRLPRRAASRASSRAPSPPPAAPASSQAEEAHAEPPQPRRTLVRRAGRPKAIIGIDDTTMELDGSTVSSGASQEPPPPVARPDPVVPPTPGRTSRLKRRVGTQAQTASSGSQLFPESADVLVPEAEEPPHKKYKTLFEASDPDRVAGMSLDQYGSQHVATTESMTQYDASMAPPSAGDSMTRTTGTTGLSTIRSAAEGSGPRLAALMEEEEESTLATSARGSETQTQSRGTKRKSQEVDGDEDGEMQDGEDAPPRSKRRVGDEVSQVSPAQPQARSKPLSQIVTRVDMANEPVHVMEKPASKKTAAANGSRTGAAPGEPDKDHAFLKAVASTKRGKKTEDTFDREFNNLRISKPELDRVRESESEKWAVLDDFGDDGDVRGNFMVVVEMPVFRESGNGGGRDHLRRGEGRLEWQGRPDFKKFRRKNAGERRQPVELVVEEEEGDLGIGSQYWKGASQAPPMSQSYSQARSQPKVESEDEQVPAQHPTQRNSKRLPSMVADDDDDDENEDTMIAPSKPTSRSKSQGKKLQASKPPSSQRTRASSRKATEKMPLFIGSDVEEENEDLGGADLDDAFASEDEDDGPGATLRSTATRGGTTQGTAAGGRRRRAPAVADDDSDDGATFKAFGARTRSRRR
ncbi:hypothetical protein C8Q77DRAFT_1272588 [Trametes polyzona]|nr:hypothetical protein C8Q77DRAFT_1272588 [Trametes polyzona]